MFPNLYMLASAYTLTPPFAARETALPARVRSRILAVVHHKTPYTHQSETTYDTYILCLARLTDPHLPLSCYHHALPSLAR